jgi:hypothetical protein
MYFNTHSEEKPNYYVGYFKKGKFNGQGRLYETFFDGKTSCYEGEFKKDFPHGYGTQYYQNKSAYACGKFNYGELNGLAILNNFTNGITFAIGKVRDFTPCQKAHFVYSNGDNYFGKCKGFSKHGKGTLYCANGDIITGKFKNDKLNGKAYLNTLKSDHYICFYENGKQISKIKTE